LWNGEYYIQLIDPNSPPSDQFGEGCLADQLFGQWWAHLLDLGHILPEEHVKTTLRSIVQYNFRESFQGFTHGYRVFADQDDRGLLVCTWPHGGRPEIPVRYCDEVWTGMEYQVGAHCIMEGLVDEGLKVLAALRERYNGTRRNPYNEIECGDHYARAMAGWSALEAISGFHYNALESALCFAPAEDTDVFRAPFITSEGWGTFEQRRTATGWRVELSCAVGQVEIERLRLAITGTNITVTSEQETLVFGTLQQDDGLTLAFEQPITLEANTTLVISAAGSRS
jgi:hypothetical protein